MADETNEITGADVKRVIEDGKVLFAFDRSQKVPLKPVTDYFVRADHDGAGKQEAVCRGRGANPQPAPCSRKSVQLRPGLRGDDD